MSNIANLGISLFDAPRSGVIVHACNSQGVWGSGIAAEFKKRYPDAFLCYEDFCIQANQRRGTAVGMAGLSRWLHATEAHQVGWIITSHNYGSKKDPKELIKINTTLALKELCRRLYIEDGRERIDVYSNKFNSGLFGVPWDESLLILETVLRDYKRIDWHICDPR